MRRNKILGHVLGEKTEHPTSTVASPEGGTAPPDGTAPGLAPTTGLAVPSTPAPSNVIPPLRHPIVEVDDDIVDQFNRRAVDEKSLNDAVDVVKSLDRGGGRCLRLAGRMLKHIRDHLFMQRREDGCPKYKSFEQFVTNELPSFSRTHANRLIKVADNFSDKEIDKFGTTKLFEILGAPKKDQPALLDKAKEGAPATQIAKEARGARDRDHEEKSAKAEQEGKPAPKRRGPRPRKSVSSASKRKEKATEEALALGADANPRQTTAFFITTKPVDGTTVLRDHNKGLSSATFMSNNDCLAEVVIQDDGRATLTISRVGGEKSE